MQLYVRDNFFNSGVTEIMDDSQKIVGSLDLKSTFGSSLSVYDAEEKLVYSGKFPFFSRKWIVTDGNGDEVGVLCQRMAFFSKRYEYEAYGKGVFVITSPAFSKEYEVCSETGEPAAQFDKINSWFSSDAYRLNNHSDILDSYELIAVIMGMHAIQKMNQNSG